MAKPRIKVVTLAEGRKELKNNKASAQSIANKTGNAVISGDKVYVPKGATNATYKAVEAAIATKIDSALERADKLVAQALKLSPVTQGQQRNDLLNQASLIRGRHGSQHGFIFSFDTSEVGRLTRAQNYVADQRQKYVSNIKSQEGHADQALAAIHRDEYALIQKIGKEEGLSTKQINSLLADEKAANRAEIKALDSAQAKAGAQTLGLLDGSYKSSMSFAEELPRLATMMNNAYAKFDQYNIPFAYRDGKSIIGLESYVKPGVLGSGLEDLTLALSKSGGGPIKVSNYAFGGNESPRTAPGFVHNYNSIVKEYNNPTLSKEAKLIDSGKDANGNRYEIFNDRITTTGSKGGVSGTFVKYSDGRIQLLSAAPNVTRTGGSFWSRWGGLILGVASGFALGPLATSLGGGTATIGSTVAAGGLLGAGSSALTGGNILTGALLGAAGGYASGVVGAAGGLGNYLKNAGVGISDDLARTLNTLVSGTAVASPDDIAAARTVVNNAISTGAVADDAAAALRNSIDEIAQTSDDLVRGGTLNQANPNVATNVPGTGFTATNPPTTLGGYGLTSPDPAIANAVADAFRNVSFANADEVTQAAINAARAAGQNISLTMPGGEFVLTATPDGLVTQTPFNQFGQTGPVFGAGQTPGAAGAGAAGAGAAGAGTSIIDDAINFVRENPLTAAGIAAGVVGAVTQTPPITGEQYTQPAWVTDPSQSAVFDRITAAQQAVGPAQQPLPNLFNAPFQRGGLGAGQFIGYDILNRTGNIPQQTLLGASPLALPIQNLLGVTGGQTPTSQTALV